VQRKAARVGRRGKDASWKFLRPGAARESHHNVGTRGHDGRQFQSSRHPKLERKRNAAAGCCREYSRREGGLNQWRPEDFGVRALWRANAISPIVNRRSSVNRSSCGRRTSPLPARPSGRSATPALPISIAFMQMFSK
jgi:hypothetical protein